MPHASHPYASLVDAIQAELRPYYSTEWSRERANNLAMACAEPDIRLRDIELMLRASGERPEPWNPAANLPCNSYQRLQLAGNILATALAQTNRRLRLAAF